MMFLSYPFLKLIENKLNPKFDIAVKLSIIAVFLNYFIQLALTIFEYADFEEMAPITYVILAITSIIVVIAIIFSRPEKYTERNSLFILSLPIFFAILSVLIDVLAFADTDPLASSPSIALNIPDIFTPAVASTFIPASADVSFNNSVVFCNSPPATI